MSIINNHHVFVKTVNDAKALVVRLSNLDALIDAYRAEEDNLYGEKLFAAAEEKSIARSLKKPVCSSRYRAAKAIAEKAVAEHKSLKALRLEAETERKLVKSKISAIYKQGNPFAVETAKHFVNWKKRQEAAKKIETIGIDIRLAPLATAKATKNSFRVQYFDHSVILKEYMPFIEKMKAYKPHEKGASGKAKEPHVLATELQVARKAKDELMKFIVKTAKDPIVVEEKDATINRLGESVLSRSFGIETEGSKPTKAWIVIEHEIQEIVTADWRVFGTNRQEASAELEKIQKALYRHVGMRGIEVVSAEDEHGSTTRTLYKGLAASASHQKQEKLIMADERLTKVHELVIYGGRTEEEAMKLPIDGAKWWKIRANMLRPITKELRTAKGEPVYLHDAIAAPVAKKTYAHKHALTVGGENAYKEGPATSSQIIGDGAILYLEQMENAASQLTAFGLKGMGIDVRSPETYTLKKNGILTRPDRMPDGRSLKGKKIIMDEGCFKFDDLGYRSWDEYAAAMDKLAVVYPGINKVYVLREADDVDGENKKRTVSRSLLQQFLNMGAKDISSLVKATISKIKDQKNLGKAWASFAQLRAKDEDRSPYGKLFMELPVLMLNDNVQLINKQKFTAMLLEAMADYLCVEAQYPYIMQDPAALYEVWVLGKDANDPDLGVLKEGEISVNAVPDRRKVGTVRYPANTLTAKTLVNRACSKIFESCGNVAILSVHDDILIRQDGDVDGDEMFVTYNKIVIRLIDEMNHVFQPWVILFQHGTKKEKTVAPEFMENLVINMYDSLYKAKKYDSVGKYANLSRSCLYLARIALMEGRMDDFKNLLLWAALASTGAIISIDQVKGNDIDMDLIELLNTISRAVAKMMSYKHPYTQQFIKQDITADMCLPENDLVATDKISTMIRDAVGEYTCDFKGMVCNKDALEKALFDESIKTTVVRKSVVTEGVVMDLRNNYFRDANNPDQEVLKLIKAGKPVGQKDLLLLYWRNACALSYRMDGDSVLEKKEEYYKMVRNSLVAQALSTEWVCENGPMAGHVFTKEEKIASVVKAAVSDALELRRGNALVQEADKASFCRFVLSVFAEDLLQNIRKNGWSILDFTSGMPETAAASDEVDFGYEETDFDAIVEASIPELTEEEMAEAAANLANEDMYLGCDEDMMNYDLGID